MSNPAVGDGALREVLGPPRYDLVKKAKLLVVGAGGIGCELLKNLVLSGFQDIEVVDLDTIDVSNLNRQFLFRRTHVDRSKAEVAAEAVQQFAPHANVKAHHANVKDSRFGVEFVSRFDAVVNALDNLEARRHVNRLCLAAERPLLEAGSTGHLGQVTVIKKGETECFECQEKPTQKVYPYCSIRSTPEKPVHCLIWAKNLFNLCFGPEDESNLLSDLAEDMRSLQNRDKVDGQLIGKLMFSHLFDMDIRKQAALEDLWSERRHPPRPLTYEGALQLREEVSVAPQGASLLDVQRVPAVTDDAANFVQSVSAMYTPGRRDLLGKSVFSKDDPIAMDFVHSAANLRMCNYRIGRLSRWDAQSIAGAIVPAVASTNAIVAGLEVVQLIHVLSALSEGKKLQESRSRGVWVRYPEPSRKKILYSSSLLAPNLDCFVCGMRTARVAVRALAEWKMGVFVKSCIQGSLGAVRPAVYLNGSLIFDPDYPEPSDEAREEGMHPDWTLTDWGVGNGCLLQIEDEGQGFSCNVAVREEPCLSEEQHPSGFVLEAGGALANGNSSGPSEGKSNDEHGILATQGKNGAETSNGKRKAEGFVDERSSSMARIVSDNVMEIDD